MISSFMGRKVAAAHDDESAPIAAAPPAPRNGVDVQSGSIISRAASLLSWRRQRTQSDAPARADHDGSAPVVQLALASSPGDQVFATRPASADAVDDAAPTETAVSSRIASLRARALAEDPVTDLPAEEGRPQTDGDGAEFPDVAAAILPADPDSGDDAPSIAPTRASRAIVLREQFPPPLHPGLSFYGGKPIVPPGFAWPLGHAGVPLHFLLQVDCAQLPDEARQGLLPQVGVLHFFLDLETGGPGGSCVILHPGPDGSWTDANPPAALPQLYGEEAAWAWPWLDPEAASAADLPRLLPRWPFEPIALELPESDGADDRWWNNGPSVTEALFAAQGDDPPTQPFAVVGADGGIARPFARFPHDWRCVAIASAMVLERVRSPAFDQDGERRGTAPAQVAALRAEYLEQAGECLAWAESHPPFKRVPRDEADMFWDWLLGLENVTSHILREAATLAVEATLAEDPDAAQRLGDDALAPIHSRHALAAQGDYGTFAPVPNRMLALPSQLQDAEPLAPGDVLLLEVASHDGIGHRFGEGVFQFVIDADDLRAGRLECTRLVVGAR